MADITGFKTVAGDPQKIDVNALSLGTNTPNDGDVLTYKDETIKWSSAAGGTSLTAGTDLAIEDGGIKVNTNGTADGDYAFVEGKETLASGIGTHAEGTYTSALSVTNPETQRWSAYGGAHAEGIETFASGYGSHAEGYETYAVDWGAHAEGGTTSAIGDSSHAEGEETIASGNNAHAEGCRTSAIGDYTHAEGDYTLASGGSDAHAEGYYTSAFGYGSHAEGDSTLASGDDSHAEGSETIATGDYSHAEGDCTSALGYAAHAEGEYTSAFGNVSHAEGSYTIAEDDAMHVGGKYNETSSGAAFVIGNGTRDDARSDALVVDWSGNVSAAGTLAISGFNDVGAAITSIAAINTYEKVNGTSTADITNPTTKTIYLIPDISVTGADIYQEWICTNTATPTFEMIGDTSIDLSNYVPLSSFNELHDSYTALSASYADLSSTFATYSGQWLIGTSN